MIRFFRCGTCARGMSIKLDLDDAVVAVIAPCQNVFERQDKKIRCPGRMVHRAYRRDDRSEQ